MTSEPMDDALLLELARLTPAADDAVKRECMAVMRGERQLSPELTEAARIVSERGAR